MKILVGISGSIAAYRSPDFVKELVKMGHEVRVVLTAGAQHFVSSKVLETFSGHTVAGPDPFSADLLGTDHIASARWAETIFIYGATANFLARLAQGIADDFLNLQILAFKGGRVWLAPAMNTAMWENPIVQSNVQKLSATGYQFVSPIEGPLACGENGTGHIAEHSQMFAALFPPAPSTPFTGKRVLISGGPMRTAIDPVRFIQNTSSGGVSVQLARAFRQAGAQVTLLLGPVDSRQKDEAQKHAQTLLSFEGYEDYARLVGQEFPECDWFISAAAVLDFVAVPKVEKDSRAHIAHRSFVEIPIQPTLDLLQSVCKKRRPGQKVVGFALETGDRASAQARAFEKLANKGCDAVILNLAENIWSEAALQQWILHPNGSVTAIQASNKSALADQVVSILAKTETTMGTANVEASL